MRGTNTRQQLPDRLHMLLYWLANEDVYTSDYVRDWLSRTPPDEAADDLARIALNAGPEPHSLWYSLMRGTLMVLATSDTVSEKGPAGRKAGTRAALLLANRDDPRSLAPLVRVFETEALWRGRYQDAIESALLRLLLSESVTLESGMHTDLLRALATRLWRIGNGRKELPLRLADLLIAILRRLRAAEAEENAGLLEAIAAERTTTPNRARVMQAASALLNSPEDAAS